MKITRHQKALSPKFIENFDCVGSDCRDTCCAGWQIPVDKATFHFYKTNRHPLLKLNFEKDVKLTRQANKSNYGTMKLKEQDNSCAFLDNGLCKIQKTLGADALCDTCSTYPRISLKHGDLLQQGLTPSCPESAKLILLQNTFTDFLSVAVPVREDQVTNIKYPDQDSFEAAQAIRYFSMRILRVDSYSTWEKMAILGFFCDQIDGLQKNYTASQVDGIINEYNSMMEDGKIRSSLGSIGSYPEVQSKVFSVILFTKLFNNNTPFQKLTLQKFSNIVFEGRAEVNGLDFLDLVQSGYQVGMPNLGDLLLASGFEKFFDNFLVNQMFNDAFPFNGRSVFDSYIKLVAKFGLLRMFLALACSNPKLPVNIDFLVDLTQIYSRKFEHDQQFKESVNSALESSGFCEMKYILGLIRD